MNIFSILNLNIIIIEHKGTKVFAQTLNQYTNERVAILVPMVLFDLQLIYEVP